jgi:hypothetical protein
MSGNCAANQDKDLRFRVLLANLELPYQSPPPKTPTLGAGKEVVFPTPIDQ